MPTGLEEGTAADALQDVVEVGTEGTNTVESRNDVNGYIAMVIHLYRRGGERVSREMVGGERVGWERVGGESGKGRREGQEGWK